MLRTPITDPVSTPVMAATTEAAAARHGQFHLLCYLFQSLLQYNCCVSQQACKQEEALIPKLLSSHILFNSVPSEMHIYLPFLVYLCIINEYSFFICLNFPIFVFVLWHQKYILHFKAFLILHFKCVRCCVLLKLILRFKRELLTDFYI